MTKLKLEPSITLSTEQLKELILQAVKEQGHNPASVDFFPEHDFYVKVSIKSNSKRKSHKRPNYGIGGAMQRCLLNSSPKGMTAHEVFEIISPQFEQAKESDVVDLLRRKDYVERYAFVEREGKFYVDKA